jgi:hypothetical protein
MMLALYRPARLVAPLALWALLLPAASRAADPKPGPPLTIVRATGAITVDGDLSDPGWQGVPGITTWFETRVGDNVEPQVGNVAYLAYDDDYFYAGFRFEDPNPTGIRAPLGDHDAVPSSTDYAGAIIDSRNDGKTAQMFLANPRGVQYDALSSDVTGEDNAPDYFWDSAGKITATGWNLEIRVPFSSLRYANIAQPTWGILLYRNYPRDRRYQFFTARLPRDVACFICNSSKLTGLERLPHGSHLVVAPFSTASLTRLPSDGLGTPFEDEKEADVGLDVKWNPAASAAIDATVNPDFSQIESDAAQIVANERFALAYPEKRPFFLEGGDLFSTPIQAVYTRTITSPRAGLRATGRARSLAYTALVTHDRGGGVVVLPGPQGSDVAPQDFASDVGIARVRRDFGSSFVSGLFTGRAIEGGGDNFVGGPDFQWRPDPSNNVTGQALWSRSRTPNRPDLAAEWDGRTLEDRALLLYGQHGSTHFDFFLQGLDVGPDFRTDDGFVPQVGYREAFLETGLTARPKDAFFSRIRLFTVDWADWEPDGDLLTRRVSVGTGMDGQLNSFTRIELNRDEFLVGHEILQRFRPRVYFEASPGRLLNYFNVNSYFGDEVDFENAREGSGVTLSSQVILRPSTHLELNLIASRRWLDIDEPTESGRLFTAEVERARATWSFNSRSFVRLIGQYERTRRDTSLYHSGEDRPKSERLTGSALFAYKLNWQTVVYVGYGDGREYLRATDALEDMGHQAFAKISYAWQR